MGILGDFTLEQLLNILLPKTKEEILAIYNNKLSNLTKRELIILVLKICDVDVGNYEIPDREEGEDDSRGQLWQLRVFRDILGNKLRSTRQDYTYYPPQPDGTEPRDTVTLIEMDADDKVIGIPKKLKHYTDGKQPEWIE